jgi:drug/metabolite transporter (DMT)-like permease
VCCRRPRQFFYFKALAISESGIVAAYWNLLPFLLLVIGYLLLGEQLSKAKYVGSACLILASVLFCLVDTNLQYRWYSLWFMFLGSCFQAAYFLLLDRAFQCISVYPAFLIATMSMILLGLAPLLFSGRRKLFSNNWPRIWKAARFLLAIEVANLLAVATSQYAIKYGQASLVASVEATIPAYTLGISWGLYTVFRRFGEAEASHRLTTKLALTGLMIIGVWLVS